MEDPKQVKFPICMGVNGSLGGLLSELGLPAAPRNVVETRNQRSRVPLGQLYVSRPLTFQLRPTGSPLFAFECRKTNVKTDLGHASLRTRATGVKTKTLTVPKTT